MELATRRLANWKQDGKTRLADADEAVPFIEHVGICTLYPAATEVASLLQAYRGTPDTKTDSHFDSPSGIVYGWRWDLARLNGAFYGLLVMKRPTYIPWPLLSSVLAFAMERRTPDELFDSGLLSADAHRIATALDETCGTMSTKALRDACGFPTGKEHRAAYTKALEELEKLLIVAKKPGTHEKEEMSHQLVSTAYRADVDRALKTEPHEGLLTLIETYVCGAAYLEPTAFGKQLKLAPALMAMAVDRGLETGKLAKADLDGREVLIPNN